MSHKLKIDVLPHTNKDGSPSKTRKDYRITDRHRKHRRLVGTVHNKKDLVSLTEAYRELILYRHANAHPNDRAFFKKHPEMQYEVI